MAKRLLLNVLVKILGEFVELDEDNLSWAVWAGQIKLNNLKLKPENILKGYQFTIYHGVVQTLEITVPWGSFLTNPLKVKLSGVLLDLGPRDVSELSRAEVIKSILERKLQKLALVDQYFELAHAVSSSASEKSQSGSSSSNEGYVQQWTSQIIDNVEISFENIHVRYEDHFSIPGQVFAAGFTLESFVLSTCNDDWQPAFVRKSNAPDAYVNKMASLNNLGVYWEPSSDIMSTLPLERWTEAMLSMIHKHDRRQQHLHYLIAPADNSMTVKLVHRKFPLEGSFQYDLTIESKNTVLAIDSQQFQQGFLFYYRLDALQNIRDPNSYRPSERPTASSEAARQWWRYAKRLIIARPKYMRMARLAKTAEIEDVLLEVLMTEEEIKEMKMLEQRLPLSVLQTFRQAALLELVEDRKERAKRAGLSSTEGDGKSPSSAASSSSTAASSSSWWSGWYGSSSSNKEDDISLKALLQSGHETPENPASAQTTALPNNFTSLSMRVTVNSSASLLLTQNFHPMIESRMAFVTSVQSLQGKWAASSEVTDVKVTDLSQAGSVFPSILSVRPIPSASAKSSHHKAPTEKPLLAVKVENSMGKMSISASALPIEIFISKRCIHAVLLTFSVPKNTFERKLRRVFTLNRPGTDQDLKSQLLQKAVLAGSHLSSQVMKEVMVKHQGISVEVDLEMHGPKIIIPEDSTQDKGCLLLDCGFLSAKGIICPRGQSFDITLKAIHAGLPHSFHDLASMADRQLYLIKPFDLIVQFQSIVKEMADSTVNVSILPELRGEVDSDKVGRLLRIMTSLSDIASPKSPGGLGHEASVGSSLHLEALSSTYNSPPPKSRHRRSTGVSGAGEEAGDDDIDSEGYLTPKGLSPPSGGKTRKKQRMSSAHANFATPIMAQLGLQFAGTSLEDLATSAQPRNPTNVDMRIGFKIPLVVLDSTYDSKNGHSIIAVKELLLDVINRPFDRTIIFDVNEFSVQDSFRHEDQKDVVRTLKSDESLIHVHFVSMNSKASPLYRSHANEVKAEFRELFINTDVNTLLHLQPLLSVLLDKRNRTNPTADARLPDPMLAPQSMMGLSGPASSDSNDIFTPLKGNFLLNPATAEEEGLAGMKIEMTMNRITIDLLQPSVSSNRPRVPLEPMFSMRIIGMSITMDMMDLLKAKVLLQTFEIVDIRAKSKDFVFTTVFCPVASREGAHVGGDSAVGGTGDLEESDAQQNVLLHVTFVQESKSHSFMMVNISGVTSFVAIDTMLEFSNIALANFLTLTSLLSSNNGDSRPEGGNTALPAVATAPKPGAGDSAPQDLSLGGTSPSAPAPETHSKGALIKSSTMNSTVKMVNSQLILLEDPAMKDSQGIVGRCALSVHFTKESKVYNTTEEVFESLHITVTDNEVFVLKNINFWNPQPILEPFDVECHVKRTIVNSTVVFNSVQVEVDDMDARLSFNDLLLAQAILSRRALVANATNDSNGEAETPGSASSASETIRRDKASGSSLSSLSKTQEQDEEDVGETGKISAFNPPASEVSVSPTLMVRFGLSSIRVVVVNDFTAISVPIVRLQLQDSNLFAEGIINQLTGEGSAQLQVDYYNARNAVWEPFVEPWTPTCRLYAENRSNILELRSEHTLQLTVSGAMLETLLRSYSLFFHDVDVGDGKKLILVPGAGSISSGNSSGIVVNNFLGDGLTVDLIDSGSKAHLVHIPDSGYGVVTEVIDASRKTLLRSLHLPEAVDVQVSGPSLQVPRLPIAHMPFNITKPKAYFLQPVPTAHPSVTVSSSASASSRATLLLEPIEEEVFENCRYDPLSGVWRKPYLPGDPYQWTDASGLVRKERDSIQLNSSLWEWSSNWEVDMDGVMGQEIDQDGWEYAASFSYFTMVSPRRCYQSLDTVRRRRWVRIRSPRISAQQFVQRSLTVIWDVQPLANGTRKVDIRSPFQIINNLGFAVLVSLSHHSWKSSGGDSSDNASRGEEGAVAQDDFVCGPLKVGDKFNVPLLRSFATHIRFKPDFPGFEWSAYVPCNVHSYDCKVVKEIVCNGVANEGTASVTFRSWTIHENKSIEVVLLPYITISNKLLCGMQYRLLSNDGKEEVGEIASGASQRCSYVNLFNDPKISIKLGRFQWSREFVLNTRTEQHGLLVMQEHASESDGPSPLLPVCLYSHLDSTFCLEIELFFQVALVDISGIDLVAKAKFNTQKDLVSRLSATQRLSSGPTLAFGHRDNLAGGALNSAMSNPLPAKKLFKDLLVNSNNLKANSVQNFDVVSGTDLGMPVYVDVNAKWTHLPAGLLRQVFIRTAFADKISRSNQFLSFTTLHKVIVFVLVDVHANLKWLKLDSFTKTSEIAVARRKLRGKVEEYHYAIYGKLFESSEEVSLKGSWDKDVQCMYSVAVVPVPTSTPSPSAATLAIGGFSDSNKLVDEVLFSAVMPQQSMDRYWIEGGFHATAFYSQDNLLSLRTSNEENWSEEISIDTRSNSSTKGSFEIVSNRSGLSYQLSYTMQNLPGIYHKTQLIKFMPRYCLLNCTEEPLLISQKGSNKYIECYPYSPEGWHLVDNHYNTEVKIRTPHTLWSLGSINLNEVGTSLLYIPLVENGAAGLEGPGSGISSAASGGHAAGSRGIVLHVEVKLATPEDNCSIIILIWRENVEAQAAMSVHNDSDVPITIRQSDIEFTHDVGDKLSLYELTVPAGRYLPFGWVDPECGTTVQVAVGTTIPPTTKRVAVINMLKAGHRLRLPYDSKAGGIGGEIILDVTTSEAGHVLHVSRSTATLFIELSSAGAASDPGLLSGEEGASTVLDQYAMNDSQLATMPLYGFNLVLGSLGVSIVVERPKRRELFSLYMDRIEVFLKSKGPWKTLDFTVLDLQLDSYSESAVYPIFVRSTKKEVHNSIALANEKGAGGGTSSSDGDRSVGDTGSGKMGEKPFIELSVAVEQPLRDAKCAIIKYLAFRILSVVVEVDSATMQILFLDLLDDLKVLSVSQALAIHVPDRWLKEFNREVFRPGQKLIDVYQSKASSMQSKMYIKTLIIHPMKITVTFFQTPFPRRQKRETLQSTVLNAAMSLVGVDHMQIRLNSFEVEDAMESVETLASLIIARALQDIRFQLGMLAGSLAMIGSPVGLARKVGSGVKAFFYEPYLGAVHGSQTFMAGLNKGTQRLFRGVVVGSLESAVAIMGTASRGMAYLTGDQEFVRKRAIRRQQNRSKTGGLYGGFVDGGESVITGITSGVKGLVSKPIEEAATGGITGFFRGIGLGMLGAAVKPLVGFAEGVTSVASGLSNQIDPSTKLSHVRPPRALQPSSADSSILVISTLSLEAAFAQDFVVQRARQQDYQDSFLGYLPLGPHNEALILSEMYVFWRRPRNLWGRVWPNVSHCVFNYDSVGIMLYSGALRGQAELVVVPCGSYSHAQRVYTLLAQNSSRMGNPAKVLPLNLPPKSSSSTASLVAFSASASTDMHHQLPSLAIPDLSVGDSQRSNTMAQEDGSPQNAPPLPLPTITATPPASIAKLSRQQLQEEAARLSELDGYRFGSVNGKVLEPIQGSEADVLARWQHAVQRSRRSWKELDEIIWHLIWEWGCIHSNLSSCRCCVTLFINRSDCPIQITRVQMLMGRRVVIMGSDATGYELESRLLRPQGYIIVFLAAFQQSPLEIGHLKANINTVAFSAVLASTQREAKCEAKGGFTTGFLEKTASEWWCKYVILTT